MVDAEIELVVHPGGALLAEQAQRLVDQVVVVEQAAPVLLGAIARDHLGRDRDQRGGALARLDRAAARDQRAHALLLGHQALEQSRMLVADAPCVTMFLRGSSSAVQKID